MGTRCLGCRAAKGRRAPAERRAGNLPDLRGPLQWWLILHPQIGARDPPLLVPGRCRRDFIAYRLPIGVPRPLGFQLGLEISRGRALAGPADDDPDRLNSQWELNFLAQRASQPHDTTPGDV